MARVKVKKEKILKSWEEVNLALKDITDYQIEMEEIETEKEKILNKIKSERDTKLQGINKKIKELSKHIQIFVEDNRSDIEGKTRQLSFGKVGFRLNTKISVKDKDSIISNLKKFNMADCIDTKETIEKNKLKKYPEEDIIKVGALLKKEDEFWYETEREKSKVTEVS